MQLGVFIPFTLSQTGMMVKWIREKPKGWIPKLIINTIGAIISFIVTIMFFLTKFPQVWSSINLFTNHRFCFSPN